MNLTNVLKCAGAEERARQPMRRTRSGEHSMKGKMLTMVISRPGSKMKRLLFYLASVASLGAQSIQPSPPRAGASTAVPLSSYVTYTMAPDPRGTITPGAIEHNGSAATSLPTVSF